MMIEDFAPDTHLTMCLSNGGCIEATRISDGVATITVPGWDYTAAEVGDLIAHLQAVQRSLSAGSALVELPL